MPAGANRATADSARGSRRRQIADRTREILPLSPVKKDTNAVALGRQAAPAKTPATSRTTVAPPSFRGLFTEELGELGVPSSTVTFGPADSDRWVTGVSADLVGLALSGGGIRSATFNLGVLQGLNALGVLKHFHYLATVSGGGYIGGWWTAYQKRRLDLDYGGEAKLPLFPTADTSGAEAHDVRHLREFSRFLAPRWGVFTLDAWKFIGAFLASFLPSIIIATASLVLGVALWGVILYLSVWLPPPYLQLYLVFLTVTVLLVLECVGTDVSARLNGALLSTPYAVYTILAGILAWLGGGILAPYWARVTSLPDVVTLTGHVWPRALIAPAGWLAAATLLIFGRFSLSRWLRGVVSPLRGPLDSVVARLFGLSSLWLVGAGLFIVADRFVGRRAVYGSVLGLVLSSSGVIAWLRRTIAARLTRPIVGGAKALLTRATPRIVFLGIFGLAVLLTTKGLQVAAHSLPALSAVITIAASVVLFSLVFLNPNEVGLHAFYRSRVSRTYLGASNYLAGGRRLPNRDTTEAVGDDFAIEAIRKIRPLLLVCCAANDTSEQSLGNLFRGARSAHLSALGFGLGDEWGLWPTGTTTPTLGEALTASGAAVNPLMGSRSIDYGRASSFLLAAVGMRLGYWIPAAITRAGRKLMFPGALFLRELAGSAEARMGCSVHLSDGGHFDNTGIYELLRRHCRYIVLADCGADQQQTFDDIGNAVRRAREDFGVEIDVTLDPLRRGPIGFAQQHGCVGRFYYPNGDIGVMVIIKPTLVGDEPDDVLQYSIRNRAFPHESTENQFYDEKQWESYRRLGQFSAEKMLGFARRYPGEMSPGELFAAARAEWHPTPARLEESASASVAAAHEIDRRLADLGSPLVNEVFPELGPAKGGARKEGSTEHGILLFVAVIQLMADVHAKSQLEQYAEHPRNVGWINYFARWTAAPSFRRWWPILSTMFNEQFVRFMTGRFLLPNAGSVDKSLGCQMAKRANADGMASRALAAMDYRISADATVYSYEIRWGEGTIEVGVAVVRIGAGVAKWKMRDIFIPRSVFAAAFADGIIDNLVRVLEGGGVGECVVEVVLSPTATEIERQEHFIMLESYRAAGFQEGATRGVLARTAKPKP